MNNISDNKKDSNNLVSDIVSQEYLVWKTELFDLIKTARLQTALKVNADLLQLYWTIGTNIIRKQKKEGWGSQVINILSSDLSSEFPDMKGFSLRNLKYMRAFALEYADFPFVQVPLAQMENENSEKSAGVTCTNNLVSSLPTIKELERKLKEN